MAKKMAARLTGRKGAQPSSGEGTAAESPIQQSASFSSIIRNAPARQGKIGNTFTEFYYFSRR
jgi:hypothetical protein